jgi:hypothetical protein
MDLHNKFVTSKFLYIDGKFHTDAVLKIGQDGKIESVLKRSELPADAEIIEFRNEVSFQSFYPQKVALA